MTGPVIEGLVNSIMARSWCERCHKPSMISYDGHTFCADCFNREQAKMAKVMDAARIKELESEVQQSWKLLWILAKRKGGKLTFTPTELQTMKQGGQLQRTVDAEGVVTLEALSQ